MFFSAFCSSNVSDAVGDRHVRVFSSLLFALDCLGRWSKMIRNTPTQARHTMPPARVRALMIRSIHPNNYLETHQVFIVESKLDTIQPDLLRAKTPIARRTNMGAWDPKREGSSWPGQCFHLKTARWSKGDSLTLGIPAAKANTFAVRVVSPLNMLPLEVNDSPSEEVFQRRLDACCAQVCRKCP